MYSTQIEKAAAVLFYIGIGLMVVVSALLGLRMPALHLVQQSIAVLFGYCWICHFLILLWAGCWSRRTFTEVLFVRTGTFGMVGASLGMVLVSVGLFTSELLVRISLPMLAIGSVSLVLGGGGYSLASYKQRVRVTNTPSAQLST